MEGEDVKLASEGWQSTWYDCVHVFTFLSPFFFFYMHQHKE